MIQGSLSIDAEDKENCTIIFPKIHIRLENWWDRVIERGLATNGPIHCITASMLTAADQENFNTTWTPVPCGQGDVRIILSLIPHGSTRPTTKIRRTMLPRFVAVDKDHVGLEMENSGSYEEIARAHKNLETPPCSPSGFANHYGKLPYCFPGSVPLTGLGPLSDALVGRQRWDSPTVSRERDQVLGDQSAILIEKWRRTAIVKVLDAFHVVKEEEKHAFGPKSYFALLEKYPDGNFPAISEDADPAPDYEDDLWEKYCG